MIPPSPIPAARAEPEPEATEDAELDEVLRLLAHRTLGLLDLGFGLEQVLRLVRRPDVVHDAERLLKRGASHSFVVDELGED